MRAAAPGVYGSRGHNIWLEFEGWNPILFPGGLWSPPGKSKELFSEEENRWYWPDDKRSPWSLVFSFGPSSRFS